MLLTLYSLLIALSMTHLSLDLHIRTIERLSGLLLL